MLVYKIQHTLCHIQRHVKKKKRSNRITGFTVLIFMKRTSYCLIKH
nr:MAG TPA: hypothetical protein [Crassvirales sp.]